MKKLAAIILAAGKSTRMQSEMAKVLHPVCGKPMLNYALDACTGAGIERIIVVVGHQADRVKAEFADRDVSWALQAEQLGTGHAVLVCEDALKGFVGDVVILAGDMPLIRAATVKSLIDAHRAKNAAVSLGTTELDDPTGYGRIVRDNDGHLKGILEHNDCTPEQLKINEVNPSYYCFDCAALFSALHGVTPNAAKGEYYITDAVHILVGDGLPTASLPGLLPAETMGVNSQQDLATVEAVMLERTASENAAS
jgi:UDP-N-acetylglucosamine diphosphorylase/glucosamine-1-phosphate N-acetyltransferase